MRVQSFIAIFMFVTFWAIVWRIAPAELKAKVKGFVLRHWWVPVAVFAGLGALVSVLSLFPIRTF